MKNNKLYYGILSILIIAPLVYLALIWDQIPKKVAVHFDINGNPDRYGSKSELWVINGFFAVLMLIVAMIIKLDPKKENSALNMPRFRVVVLAVAGFLSLIQFIIIYASINKGQIFSTKLIIAGVFLLLAIIGNYSQNLKPNYMFGFRTPWTLDNEEVWRQTHLIMGKWTFYGGLIGSVLCLSLPNPYGFFVLITGILIMVISLFYVSYSIHKKVTNQ
jgi:uncharacterized membrane protein